MNLVTKIEQLSKTALFSDNLEQSLDGLNGELKACYLKGNQLKLREMFSPDQEFADTVEVVSFDD